ncbi:MAG TPA: NUDIX hydrolase [Bryobacteraceae bacterium]|nr:NUDIX hydrolase [Bryobacteraceae bacterium]
MLKAQSSTKSRRYPDRPVLGIGALIIEGNRILLVERGREPLKGYWSLPGGALETGETLAEGICREVLEETGLLVSPTRMFEIFERILRDDGGCAEYHYVLMDYLCEVTGGALQAGDDVSKVAWFDRGALIGLRLTEGTLAVIERAFAA